MQIVKYISSTVALGIGNAYRKIPFKQERKKN